METRPVRRIDALLARIRNLLGYQSVRVPALWIRPLAAPVLVARLRRPNDKE